MSKEIDEIKEKIAQILADSCGGAIKLNCSDCGFDAGCGEHWRVITQRLIKQILEAETDTLRVAIVKKKAELPPNPYPKSADGIMGRYEYKRAQKDILNIGFVQEEKWRIIQ